MHTCIFVMQFTVPVIIDYNVMTAVQHFKLLHMKHSSTRNRSACLHIYINMLQHVLVPRAQCTYTE